MGAGFISALTCPPASRYRLGSDAHHLRTPHGTHLAAPVWPSVDRSPGLRLRRPLPPGVTPSHWRPPGYGRGPLGMPWAYLGLPALVLSICRGGGVRRRSACQLFGGTSGRLGGVALPLHAARHVSHPRRSGRGCTCTPRGRVASGRGVPGWSSKAPAGHPGRTWLPVGYPFSDRCVRAFPRFWPCALGDSPRAPGPSRASLPDPEGSAVRAHFGSSSRSLSGSSLHQRTVGPPLRLKGR